MVLYSEFTANSGCQKRLSLIVWSNSFDVKEAEKVAGVLNNKSCDGIRAKTRIEVFCRNSWQVFDLFLFLQPIIEMTIMKQIRLLMLVAVCLLAFASCDKTTILTVDQLPVPAQEYIKKSYHGIGISYVKQEKEVFKTRYDVRLNNGLEIEFDGDGAPLDIDAD